MKHIFTGLFLSLFIRAAVAQSPVISPAQYRQDFDFFLKTIEEEYCYFEKKNTDWAQVKTLYTPAADSFTNRNAFVAVLEKTFYEIYDHHAGLNTNTDLSRRLVPSGTDIWAEFINGKPVITELRKGFGAEKSGMLPGMEVIAVNDIPAEKAIAAFLPLTVKPVTVEAKNFALRLMLAGDHVQARKLTLKKGGIQKDFFPDKAGFLLEHISYPALIESKISGSTGYIKINDCLYDNDLIPAFDSVMERMEHTKALILDLRETASGGNTSVAKAMLGWFINKEHFYQKHEYYAEEKSSGIKRSWVEIVSPRKGKYYSNPLVILCNHWTGSVGEGIVIGFDALHRANTTIIGTELARLNGAVYSFEMPNTKIRFSFPAERLFHINGLPREKYIPPVYIDLLKPAGKNDDIFMTEALKHIAKPRGN